ncbi:15929_t:CDS:2 [Rhizophagus irregularis]|nr:15929_t:CDS:2 [Rhizophagus irregularis]
MSHKQKRNIESNHSFQTSYDFGVVLKNVTKVSKQLTVVKTEVLASNLSALDYKRSSNTSIVDWKSLKPTEGIKSIYLILLLIKAIPPVCPDRLAAQPVEPPKGCAFNRGGSRNLVDYDKNRVSDNILHNTLTDVTESISKTWSLIEDATNSSRKLCLLQAFIELPNPFDFSVFFQKNRGSKKETRP